MSVAFKVEIACYFTLCQSISMSLTRGDQSDYTKSGTIKK